jgi:hypothetical protein
MLTPRFCAHAVSRAGLVVIACNLACSDRPSAANDPGDKVVRALATKDSSIKSPQDWSVGYTQWWQPENVVALGGGRAMAEKGKKQTWSKFQFGLPAGATINSVVLKTRSGSGGITDGCQPYQLTANLRTASQTSASVVQNITAVEDNMVVDFTFTGLTGWTAVMVNGDDFGVDLTASCACDQAGGIALVDYLAMGVNYTTHCPAGTTSDPNDPAACVDCAPGTYNAAVDGTCQSCAAGTFASQAGATACTTCPAGQYSASTGASTCQSCPAGQEVNASKTGCVACSPGSISASGSSCTLCPVGTESNATGTSCVACSPGYQSVAHMPCQLCPMGMKGSNPPSDSCIGCLIGQHSTPDRTACVVCASGWISWGGSDTCTKCLAGTYASPDGAPCTPCIHGKYSSTDEAMGCLSCPAGTKATGDNPQNGNTRCEACTGGSVSMSPVDDTCNGCEPGLVPNAEHSACVACSGNQISRGGQAACTDCPPDTYTIDHMTCLWSRPEVASVNPASGSRLGGTVVTVTGQHFTPADAVTVGGVPATSVALQNSTTLTAVTPANAVGPAVVVVSHPAGGSVLDSDRSSSATPSDKNTFTYEDGAMSLSVSGIMPLSVANTGGTPVTITGFGFRFDTTTVSFGGTPATSVTVVSSEQLTAITPAHVSGRVRVTVSNGTQTAVCPDLLTFWSDDPNPASLWSVNPSVGSPEGGTRVTLTGAFFDSDVMVTFGGTPATIIAKSSGELTVLSPAHAPGSVEVTVINPGRLQSATQAGAFTYALVADAGAEAGRPADQKDAAGGKRETPIIIDIIAGPPNASGAIPLTILGANFSPAALVYVGGVVIPALTQSPQRIDFLPPPLAPPFMVGVVNPEDGQRAEAIFRGYTPDGGLFVIPDSGGVNPGFDGGPVIIPPPPRDGGVLADAPQVPTEPDAPASPDAALPAHDAPQADQRIRDAADAGASDLGRPPAGFDASPDQVLAEGSGGHSACSCRLGSGHPGGTSLWLMAIALLAIAKARTGERFRRTLRGGPNHR